MRSSILLLSQLLATANTFAVSRWFASPIVHESIGELLPSGWSYDGKASPNTQITLRAYLKHAHQNYIQLAEDISDPTSTRFRRHLSAEELVLALPDTSSSAARVLWWLNQNNIRDHESSSDWVDFTTSVDKANHLLGANFASYRYFQDEPVIRTQNYTLPPRLINDIDFVYPTIHLLTPRKGHNPSLTKRQHPLPGSANCTNSVCPPELVKKYNISYRPVDSTSGSRIGITGFLNNFPNITDVQAFLSKYGVKQTAPFPNLTVTAVANGITSPLPNRGDLTVEPELDLDYSLAFTGPLPVTFYSTGGRGTQLDQPGNKPTHPSFNEPYLAFLQHILAEQSPPQVISISYSDDEQSVPQKYATRVCSLFAQAAARGISIIGSSGDGGAAGTGTSNDCVNATGKFAFVPTFPSSCPWYTSVGATAGFGGAASFSSGGLSNYFARPKWQDAAVSQYLEKVSSKQKGLYNATGRGIPDVSLLGDDYLTLTGGAPDNHDGTSASTPVFAAMIALINDVRLRSGKPVLGFLNPLLYAAQAQQAFNDIKDGSETEGCANSDKNFFVSGWKALKGWDAATGLGEPDFEKLRQVLA